MKTFFALLAALILLLSVPAAILAGIGSFAYGIYIIVLLVKGTLAVSFLAVFKACIFVVFCWAIGYLTFFIGAAIAGLFGAIGTLFD